DTWEQRQELAFALQLHPADCEVCLGALQAAERRLAALASRAANMVQRCDVARRRLELYAMLGTAERAVLVGLECLRHVGIDWAIHPTDAEARREYECIWSRLGSRAIEDLADLPLMEDPEVLATVGVLTSLMITGLYTNANLGTL